LPDEHSAPVSDPAPYYGALPPISRTSLEPSRRRPSSRGQFSQLLIDGAAHFDAWLNSIRGAHRRVLLENYIVRDDEIGREFRAALVERAKAGILVAVIVDWLGCLGQSRKSFWAPLRAAGGQLRVFNPPQFGEPIGWISRDHRKLLVVDGMEGFLSGVCISSKWLGDPLEMCRLGAIRVWPYADPPWPQLEDAFKDSWNAMGAPLDHFSEHSEPAHEAGSVALRIIATQPPSASLYRLDQLIASMARKSLWLCDAYFVGIAPYVQALVAAARDGVDVRMLVPGSSDVPSFAACRAAATAPCWRREFVCSSGTVRCCTRRRLLPIASGRGRLFQSQRFQLAGKSGDRCGH